MNLTSDWELMCKRTQKFASNGRENVRSALATELVDEELEKLRQLVAPESEEEMQERRRQVADLSGRITLVVNAAWLARARAEVAARIFDIARECLCTPLAKNAVEVDRSRKQRADAQDEIARLCRTGE